MQAVYLTSPHAKIKFSKRSILHIRLQRSIFASGLHYASACKDLSLQAGDARLQMFVSLQAERCKRTSEPLAKTLPARL